MVKSKQAEEESLVYPDIFKCAGCNELHVDISFDSASLDSLRDILESFIDMQRAVLEDEKDDKEFVRYSEHMLEEAGFILEERIKPAMEELDLV